MSVKHTACPRCRELGKDKTGDNLALFPDGGKFCFSCGYSVLADKYIPQETAKAINSFVPTRMPELFRVQLREYLDDEEIDDHFSYDVVMNRVVLKDTLPYFYWGRDKLQTPKVFTRGDVPFAIFGEDMGDVLVVVEDPISAITVSRIYPAVPLFGSYLNHKFLHNLLVSKYKRIVLWLDQDKSYVGLRLALSLRHLKETHWVMSMLDPKAYNTEEMYDILYKLVLKEKLNVEA